ncbi:hypothetical protein [Tranquillimonas rosea]|uniref:hypothetical protein n=1 Tax=Tranquillimonas rosea TaxID=641238 RepID=UPI003BA88A2E
MAYELSTLDQILALPDGGEFLQSLLAQHAELMASLQDHVNAHHKKASGSMTLKLSFGMDKHGTVEIKADADFKPPKEPAAKAIAWMGSDNRLTPQNPRQTTMDLRDVTTRDADLRSAN